MQQSPVSHMVQETARLAVILIVIVTEHSYGATQAQQHSQPASISASAKRKVFNCLQNWGGERARALVE